MKKLRFEVIFIALSIVVLGLCIKSGLNSISDNSRVVTVKGLAEQDVEADRVIWPVQFRVVGNNLGSLYKEVNANSAVIRNFLIKNGIKESEIAANAPQVVDRAAETYSNGYTDRYSVSSTMTVSTSNVRLVRKLLAKQGDLIEKGISIVNDYSNQVVYEFTKLNSVKPKMIETATRNARIAADKFATDSQSELGKIKNANQGQISISDRDDNTHYIKKIRVVTSIEYYLKD
ncbi:MAG: SIMPL domain-containing protein [Paludibacteraceae bacterium]|nr:SIMPL domain-containing protein [Paludibacteraceae bacterium]MBR6285506.1 SIMPL domain-containing protein [Bacteroidaceae bacterium]